MPRKLLQENQEEAYEWDKIRIAIAIGILVLLIVGGIFAKKYILSSAGDNSPKQNVQGVNTQNSGSGTNTPARNASLNFSLPSTADLQTQLNNLEQKIQHLSVADVASASPQVQEIIQQVQNIQNLPKDQAKSVCQQICGNYMK